MKFNRFLHWRTLNKPIDIAVLEVEQRFPNLIATDSPCRENQTTPRCPPPGEWIKQVCYYTDCNLLSSPVKRRTGELISSVITQVQKERPLR